MEMIADLSTQIEEDLPPSERAASLDSRLIVDSFNEQIEKVKRLCNEEEVLEFAPSQVTQVKI